MPSAFRNPPPPPRRRCRSCRTRIDADHARCPFCDTPDPLRPHRVRRTLAFVAAVAASLSLSAWLVLL